MNTQRFYASWHNQYTRRIGDGFGDTREEAVAKATAAADVEIRVAPNFKWVKSKLKVDDLESPTSWRRKSAPAGGVS